MRVGAGDMARTAAAWPMYVRRHLRVLKTSQILTWLGVGVRVRVRGRGRGRGRVRVSGRVSVGVRVGDGCLGLGSGF